MLTPQDVLNLEGISMENVMLKDKTVAWPRMKTNIFWVLIVALFSSMPLTLMAETSDSVPCSVKLNLKRIKPAHLRSTP